jgi:TrmH family RNA methyltransferase
MTQVLRSRDNPRVRRWQRLVRDARVRRKEARALIEGPHLLAAALAHGLVPAALIASERGMDDEEIASLVRRSRLTPVVLSEGLFRTVAGTDTPAGIAAEVPIPARPLSIERSECAALLDGIQDAGNVGAILRCAAAFGVRDVLLGPGCADPWSPKVLRAGMGAHFALKIGGSRNLPGDIESFNGTSICTVPRNGASLPEADLAAPVLWIFGAEGQGVSAALAARASLKITIPMPGGTESLNVAAAAAICFYERARQLAARGLSTPGARS